MRNPSRPIDEFLAFRQRLHIFNHVSFFLIRQAEVKQDVVVIDNVEECFEAAVMKITALVFRTHEHSVFADEYSGEIRSLVGMIGRPIRLETVNADVSRFVQIPSGLSPEWFDMTIVALGFSAEEFVPTLGGGGIEVLPGLRSRGGNSKLIELERRKFFGDQVLIRIDIRRLKPVAG
jgi:hypothetical protein